MLVIFKGTQNDSVIFRVDLGGSRWVLVGLDGSRWVYVGLGDAIHFRRTQADSIIFLSRSRV